MSTWRAGCSGSCTSGSEGGPGKPTSREADRAPRSDPYTYVPTWSGFAYPGVGDRRLFAVRRRLASIQQPTNRPGPRRPRTSTMGPATGHSRPRPPSGASLRRRQPNTCPSATRTGSPKPASNHRSARLGIPTTTPSPNRSSVCTRPLIIEGSWGRGGSDPYKTWLCAFSSICRPVPSLGA